MVRPKWALLVLVLLAASGIPALGEAISNDETFGGFQFNLNNPGARALGMGGAFTGVADDATAVVSNPAGLVILQRPEAAAELKLTRFTNTIENFSNTPAEGRQGIFHSRDFDDTVFTPSFFSFVYPTDRLVIAAFVRELVNYESNFETEGVFLPNGSRLFPVRSELSITALNFGGGVGVNLARVHPLLPNLGASLEISHGVVNSKLQRFGLGGARFFLPPDFASSNVRATSTVEATDLGYGYNVGALWKPVRDLGIGVVYRRGPRFDMQQRLESGPASLPASPQLFDFTLKVPDVYGAGVSYRLFDRLTLALDVVRIQYSQLLKNFQIVFAQGTDRPGDFKLDDATEIHLGAEYVFFVREMPFAARGGFYTDPDHKIRYTGTANPASRAIFSGGKDRYHVTAGVGVVPVPGFQLDFAGNWSESVKELVMSTVFRF
ncbi:MAG TPA: outer membrane protein transport protein [Methylomirabilota bacterium]|nr:outer membrane protein transport protein [Methylomirabilota bacterium]